jgi:hypothetical protein
MRVIQSLGCLSVFSFLTVVTKNPATTPKVTGYIRQGIAEGARLVTGGADRPAGFTQGYFVQPTVFADVHNKMTIAQEEIFGYGARFPAEIYTRGCHWFPRSGVHSFYRLTL